MTEERITNPKTGGAKGRKLARFDLFPAGPLWKVAEHYGKGAAKYEERNWERGYDWSLSFGALMRHAWAFWHGEDVDDETGSHHLAAVVFHALALLEFAETRPELDDRPASQAQRDDKVPTLYGLDRQARRRLLECCTWDGPQDHHPNCPRRPPGAAYCSGPAPPQTAHWTGGGCCVECHMNDDCPGCHYCDQGKAAVDAGKPDPDLADSTDTGQDRRDLEYRRRKVLSDEAIRRSRRKEPYGDSRDLL